jgi:hypothetical protein
MDIAHIDKCQYEIEEQKEVPVWFRCGIPAYTGPFRALTLPRKSKCSISGGVNKMRYFCAGRLSAVCA